ncbi:MAG: glycogen debranching N-terminal domain-containing protein [Candidatus Obscuribacterales bacterium]
MNTKTDSPSSRLYEKTAFKAANPSQSRHVIKSGRHFLVLDRSGMMPQQVNEPAPFGLFRDDTRFLSTWEVFLNGNSPRLLFENTRPGYQAEFVYGNQTTGDLQEQSVMISRKISIADLVHETITVTNFQAKSEDLEIAITYDADFKDMFEVRGAKRSRRGSLSPVRINRLSGALPGERVRIRYTGLDNKPMTTVIDVRSRARVVASPGGVFTIKATLAARESLAIEVVLETLFDREPSRRRMPSPHDRAARAFARFAAGGARVRTSVPALDTLIERSLHDLFVLRQPIPGSSEMALAAGTPWFACAFGRDQAVAGLQTLPVLPDLARGIIAVLAAYQGKIDDPYREEKPGKIMHELRLGEMARCKEIPFTPYYGTVDATALWLILLARYVAWTGDLDFARSLSANIEAALAYLDSSLDSRGYLTYGGGSSSAIVNQGWKDSHDSVMHEDGSQAKGPIALCEVQGYVYHAWRLLAEIAPDIELSIDPHTLSEKAASLKARFNRDFWMSDRNYVALALDGQGRQCRVVSSNPGHLLETGILDGDRARLVSKQLLSAEMFSGWGIRTLAEGEAAYNPMSYHDGSVWPHDNAMIAAGLAATGNRAGAGTILEALLSVSRHTGDQRLPELFCGFASPREEGPLSYPVSCVPQAWAAGAIFQVLVAALGIEPDARRNSLTVRQPSLPDWLDHVEIAGMRVGKHRASLRFERSDGRTSVTVTAKSRALDITLL